MYCKCIQLRWRNRRLSICIASSAVVAGGSVTGVDGASDPGKIAREESEKKDKEEKEGGASRDDIHVHVEAVVGGLELVLYSYGGGVAEVKVKGTARSCHILQLSVCVYTAVKFSSLLACYTLTCVCVCVFYHCEWSASVRFITAEYESLCVFVCVLVHSVTYMPFIPFLSSQCPT